MSEYKESLGWCEEGQTYCSVSENAYKENQFLKAWKDDVVNSLAKYDANSVEEVYQYGINRGRAEELKRFVKIFADFFGDEPCNYNGLDECTDEWCEIHCGECGHTVLECWEHAINSGWLEKEQKND